MEWFNKSKRNVIERCDQDTFQPPRVMSDLRAYSITTDAEQELNAVVRYFINEGLTYEEIRAAITPHLFAALAAKRGV